MTFPANMIMAAGVSQKDLSAVLANSIKNIPTTPMSRRATRHRQGLSPKDRAILRECVRFVGGEPGEPFKPELMEALRRGHDPRRERIMRTIRHLSEEQILAWCDHG